MLAAGLYTVQVYGVADTGAMGALTQLEVVVDATPPVLGRAALYLHLVPTPIRTLMQLPCLDLINHLPLEQRRARWRE